MPPMAPLFLKKLKSTYAQARAGLYQDKYLWSNSLVLFAFWCVLWVQLGFEWLYNPQYQYGIAVPFIGIYLLYLRYSDRPRPGVSKVSNLWIQGLAIALTVLLYPLMIVFETNIDWRMLIWLQASMVFAFSLVLVYCLGSWPWLRHFAWVFVFFLCAVPWPTSIELWLVQHLLEWVSAIAVDVLHILGVPALQNANIIQLAKGCVSMEDACSGVRSFQSSVMLAYFLGELFRLKLFQRVFLLVLGPLSAIGFNVLRTTLLALLVNAKGSAVANHWHGLAGHAVFMACLAHLSFWAFVCRPAHARSQLVPASFRVAKGCSLRFSVFIALALVLGLLCARLWYRLSPKELLYSKTTWHIRWESFESLTIEPMADAIWERLFYDEGTFAHGKGLYDSQWFAYYFTWHCPKTAQLGGFHGPELCLPSIGWGVPEEGGLLVWRQSGLELVFRNFKFKRSGHKIYVFFAQWDQSGYPYHAKKGRLREDRIVEAFKRHESCRKTNLELVIMGPKSFKEARKVVKDFLEKGLVVEFS